MYTQHSSFIQCRFTVNQAKHVDKKYSLLGFPDRVISGSVLSLGEPSLVWSSTPIRLEGRERGLRGSLTLNNSQLSKNTTLQLEEKLFLAKPVFAKTTFVKNDFYNNWKAYILIDKAFYFWLMKVILKLYQTKAVSQITKDTPVPHK